MDVKAPAVLLRFFSGLADPRSHNIRHLFIDILTIAILAVMSRSDDWDEVVLYGINNQEWLATFLELPNGIPSEDTFSRLFARISPDAFEKCFIQWTADLASHSQGRLIAVDGKSLRRSFQHGWNKQMVHMVSAWCQENQLVMGQLATDDKSNEITAIPKLLELLDIKNAVVSIDAMGCQKEIAEQIKKHGGDYLLGVKGNQKALYNKARILLKDIALDQVKGLNPDQYDYFEKAESGSWPGGNPPRVGQHRREITGQKDSRRLAHHQEPDPGGKPAAGHERPQRQDHPRTQNLHLQPCQSLGHGSRQVCPRALERGKPIALAAGHVLP